MMHVGEGRGYTAWLSALSYHHCKFMMHVGEGRGYTAWLSAVSYHHCKCMMHAGGKGGVIQLGFLLCLIIIASVGCRWARGRGYTAWLSAVSYYHCKRMMHVGEGIYSCAFCCVISLQVYDVCGGGGGIIQLGFLLCHIIIGCEKCMWGRGRGYTAWLSAVSYHHCKCMMYVGEGEGIYRSAFCCVLSSLQVYDVCGGGGGGGVIQLGFLLCHIIIGCEKCMWGRGSGYTAWLSVVSYHHCKCMMHVGEREGIYSLAFCPVVSSLVVRNACGGGEGIYTAWLSARLYNHSKCMMHVGYREGIYSLAFFCILSLQVYDACGGGGGDIQLGFLLYRIIASV